MAYSVIVLGPPGTGKSTFAASIADVVGAEHTLALCTKPREANSWGYTSRGVKTRVFFDPKWTPVLKQYEARGYLDLVQALDSLMDDDTYDAVILDPLTDAAELAYHELLKFEQAATPRDTRDSQSYYGSVRSHIKGLLTKLTLLPFAKRPKHVIVTCHLQPVNENDRKNKDGSMTKAPDKVAKGVAFEGGVLPALEGSMKYHAAGDFDAQLYTDVVYELVKTEGNKLQRVPKYVVQVQPDSERFAKVGVAPMLSMATLPNDFTAFLKAIGQAPGQNGRKK